MEERTEEKRVAYNMNSGSIIHQLCGEASLVAEQEATKIVTSYIAGSILLITSSQATSIRDATSGKRHLLVPTHRSRQKPW
jgi:hypothetical protein